MTFKSPFLFKKPFNTPFFFDGNWWDVFREEGFKAALILLFRTDQFYSVTSQEIRDAVNIDRTGPKPAWLANGDLGWAGMNNLKYWSSLTMWLEIGRAHV